MVMKPDQDVYLCLEDVSLNFPVNQRLGKSFKRRVFNSIIGGRLDANPKQGKHALSIHALSDINLSLNSGDSLHIKGHNGAGKSTLLKIMAGIYQPTTGKVHIQGHVVTLLGLSAGALMSCTGYENIYRILMLNGLNKDEVENYIPYIEKFSELSDFLSLPVSTYSSGMLMRLMFSIATCRVPEILLVDEIIGVGDEAFSIKAQNRISELIESSSIAVIATHSETFVKGICNRSYLLNKGSGCECS